MSLMFIQDRKNLIPDNPSKFKTMKSINHWESASSRVKLALIK